MIFRRQQVRHYLIDEQIIEFFGVDPFAARKIVNACPREEVVEQCRLLKDRMNTLSKLWEYSDIDRGAFLVTVLMHGLFLERAQCEGFVRREKLKEMLSIGCYALLLAFLGFCAAQSIGRLPVVFPLFGFSLMFGVLALYWRHCAQLFARRFW